MSKRAGTVVTLGDLLDDIGVDAARFFLVQRSHETPLDLDLDLAREQSQENPVYYVQYAHARVCSILAQVADARRSRPARPPSSTRPSAALVMRLADWPVAVSRGRGAPRAAPRGRLPDRARRATSTPSTTAAAWWGSRTTSRPSASTSATPRRRPSGPGST